VPTLQVLLAPPQTPAIHAAFACEQLALAPAPMPSHVQVRVVPQAVTPLSVPERYVPTEQVVAEAPQTAFALQVPMAAVQLLPLHCAVAVPVVPAAVVVVAGLVLPLLIWAKVAEQEPPQLFTAAAQARGAVQFVTTPPLVQDHL